MRDIQIYYSVSVDKTTIKRVENKAPWTFSRVKVFAGLRLPADASYKNLIWESVPNEGKVNRKTLLAITETWGPLFWVGFDLIVHRPIPGWSNVLAFKANGGESSYGHHGDRIPLINLLHNDVRHVLTFYHSVNGNPGHSFEFDVRLRRWYNIVIKQVSRNQKVKRG